VAALLATAGAALATVVAAPSAWAFHAGGTFDTQASAGGGEYIYYTGAPNEHGWKCDLCHQNPEGKISLHFSQPDLFLASGQQPYTPGAMTPYRFSVDMIGEHLGFGSSESNVNSIAVEVLDARGAPAGSVNGVDHPASLAGQSTFIPDGTQKGVTHWEFNWFPPGPTDGPDGGPPGKVTFYVAAVDGNGADAGAGVVLNDPFGDDFVSYAIDIEQAPVKTASAAPVPPGDPRDYSGAPPAVASLLTLVAFGMVHRGRRRR
jgi:hypothetical protein